jgi:glycosyltransferase involved in cell wall biosynthesis
MKTKKPSAIVYGWRELGTFTLTSDVYYEENLLDEVVVYSLPYTDDISKDFSLYKPDMIMGCDGRVSSNNKIISNRIIRYLSFPPDNVLANDIVCQATFRNCQNLRPKFSIFTPTYNTGERIYRTYESLKKQTLDDWEWVIVDDSPNNNTWNILEEISKNDYRVKVHRIYPLSEGNIGLVKHRAASLCSGEWLVELDHDDTLISTCLQELHNASLKHPNAGFMYSDVCELYEDGEMKTYDHDYSGNWYARPDNYFDFGYAGHSYVEVDGKTYINHHYPDINPLSIRFNISMPNHVRIWKKEVYDRIGGHNVNTPIADDYELIVRTFLNTEMVHIKKMLYLQWNNRNSAVDNNSVDINRRARLIRDHYDFQIHQRIIELGKHDWNWDGSRGHSQKFQNMIYTKKYYQEEEVLNHIYI